MVDKEAVFKKIDPTIQMSDINFLICDLSDGGDLYNDVYLIELDLKSKPEPYPYPKVGVNFTVYKIVRTGLAYTKF